MVSFCELKKRQLIIYSSNCLFYSYVPFAVWFKMHTQQKEIIMEDFRKAGDVTQIVYYY